MKETRLLKTAKELAKSLCLISGDTFMITLKENEMSILEDLRNDYEGTLKSFKDFAIFALAEQKSPLQQAS